MRSVLCLLLLAGCPSFGEEDEIDEGEGLFCAFETLDLLAPGLVATNPFQRNERVYESQAQCWNLTTVKNRTKNTSTASITRIAEEGPPVLGCGFTGAGTVDQVTFTEGSCVLPSARFAAWTSLPARAASSCRGR